MTGTGTMLNAAGVLLGGSIGILVRRGLKEEYQEILNSACGLASMFIGAAGTIAGMLTVENGKFSTKGSLLMVISLVLGGLIGQFVDIELRIDHLGERLKRWLHSENDARFVDGFTSASLMICVGAMAIVGALQEGLTGDYATLAVKAVIDLVIVMILAANYGMGALCAAIPLCLYEGAITFAAGFAGNFISQLLIDDLSYIGSALIFCVGVNLSFGRRFRVGNLLPALLVPVVYEAFMSVL